MTLHVKHFFHKATSTLTYVVFDDESQQAIVIDPVLDFDQASGNYWTESIDEVAGFIDSNNLTPVYLLETHVHADHLSGALGLKEKYSNAKTGINSNITKVQEIFTKALNVKVPVDGSQFDILLNNNEVVECGELTFKVLHTPGHTPTCTCFLIKDMLFTGDTIFMPDFGTGRCDFPAGCAEDLFHSIVSIVYELPDETRIFVGHDYQPGGRELAFETTVKECKANNIQLKENTSKEEFVGFRTERDSKLSAPKLLYPSLQLNINAGKFPEVDETDKMFLKVPFKRKKA